MLSRWGAFSAPLSSNRSELRGRGQPGQPPQILRYRSHQELIAGSAEPAQPHPLEAKGGLEMRKQHLDLFLFVSRFLELGRSRQFPRLIASFFMDAA